MNTTPMIQRVALALAAVLVSVGISAATLLSPAAAVESSSGGFVTSAAVSPTQITVGQSATLTASVRSDTSRRALVDLEVYDSAGRKVFQEHWDWQRFTSGSPRTYKATWSTADRAPGGYTVKVGVFRPQWASLLHWNNEAATTTVVGVSPTTSTTTTVAPTTSTAPTIPSPTTTTLAQQGKFPTLPPGTALPSGAECETRVRPTSEIRPENAAANANRGGPQYANSRTDWNQYARVDGDFAGTTDEIIQWAACKWGINEDIVRAQIIKESYWYQSANGDNGESWGLGQVRVPYHQTAFEHSAVNARNSSAYNLDYTYANWRACYEGVYTWLNTVERGRDYAAGDEWGCVGLWFSGRWYLNNDAYLNQPGDSVRWHFDNTTWLTPTFIDG